MKMLLVANQTLFRDGLKLLLQKSNLLTGVKEATTLNDALTILNTENFDLIVLDTQLRDAIGLVSLREIKRRENLTPIITITETPDAYLANQAIAYGATGHLSKTSSYVELEKAISAAKLGQVYLARDATGNLNYGSPRQNSVSDISLISSLSDRQREVLRHLAKGTSNKAISLKMNISQNTVKAHLATIFKILGVHSRTEAFYFATRAGMPLD